MRPSNEQLQSLRDVGDPVADRAYAALRGSGLARSPIEGVEKLAEEGVESAATLWNQVTTTPSWVDFDRMEPSFELALQNVIPSGLSLMAGSLVESYASARGAKVLVRTGRLESDTLRRLFETAKFASDLALHRGARVGNPAWRNVVAVRLMHARVRHQIGEQGDWRTEEWGAPVNQEDYAGTLFMFSLVYRRGLERLGVRCNEEFRRANHHVWRHVGWLMGVHDSLLTEAVEEERRLYARVKGRQARPDADSRRLAHGLLRAMAGRPPFFLPRPALYEISRLMIGDELADEFRFPRSRAWRRLWRSSRLMTAVSSRGASLPGVGPVACWTGEHLTRLIVDRGLRGEVQFR